MSHDSFLNNDQLIEVLAQSGSAIAIHITDRFVIQYASDRMISIWGKERETIIGKPLEEALPELKGQPFIDLFRKVWNEGIVISGKDTAAELEVDGRMQTFYFDFEYRAIKNDADETYCILHTATDVTERLLSEQREQRLTEEMTATNEELYAANEELNAANEELVQSQENLMAINETLVESELRFHNLVMQAPVGICIIRAADLFIDEVNNSYLELVGRRRHEMENLTIWQAIPEAAAAYAPIMNNVIDTGIPFIAKEHELVLIRDGEPENVFVDFVYEPIKVKGVVDTIMVLAIEVTDKVIARRKIEDMEERARLAADAAEIGTFDLDIANGIMITSDRFNAIFGYNKQVPWKELISAVHPDDQKRRALAFEEAEKTGKLFYEARIVHADRSLHWIRAQGHIYYGSGQKPFRMLGTLLDITEFKRLQQQKDDFLSIASHELKTPITSLKASLQLLEKMKEKPSSVMLPKLIDQSMRSMNKISALVEDLLNVSRTNESELKLNKTVFNVSELLNNCCNHVRAAGKYTLTFQGDKSLTVYADEHAIDQVLVNLVNNAVKYAPDSLEIFLIAEKQDDMVKISVKDMGPGIPEDKIPHLFQRYYQVDAAGYRNSGLGLGLYISSEIVKRHGGKIGVTSEPGKGTTFYFTLPVNANSLN